MEHKPWLKFYNEKVPKRAMII